MKDQRRQPLLQSRRELMKNLGLLTGSISFSSWLNPWIFDREAVAFGASTEVPKFLHIFLRGGWDSHLATDPIIGSKVASSAFQSDYQNYTVSTVTGKDQLVIGWGLEPARQAFGSIPTCFINGLFTEITAHELAQSYMLSGVLSLSRSREFPALTALLGNASQHFPAHVVLGSPIPLGGTKNTAPPLQAQSGGNLSDILRGPYNQWNKDETFTFPHDLITKLDQIHERGLTEEAKAKMAAWSQSSQQIEELYQAKLGQKMELTDAIKTRYGISESWGQKSLLPSAYLALAAGLSPYVTVSWEGFDTHSNHLSQHLPLLRSFATDLNLLIQDLQNAPDPHDPTRSLMATTTILISSEFVRTPLFNAGSGTDHWPSASAILMGRGVADNLVVGGTDDAAQALGWRDGQRQTRTEQTQITPSDLVATLLAFLNFTTEAAEVSEGRIDGILV